MKEPLGVRDSVIDRVGLRWAGVCVILTCLRGAARPLTMSIHIETP